MGKSFTYYVISESGSEARYRLSAKSRAGKGTARIMYYNSCRHYLSPWARTVQGTVEFQDIYIHLHERRLGRYGENVDRFDR